MRAAKLGRGSDLGNHDLGRAGSRQRLLSGAVSHDTAGPVPRQTSAAGSGDDSPPDRTTPGQRVLNCLVRIGGSKGAAGEDEIVSGHAIDHQLALLARVEKASVRELQ